MTAHALGPEKPPTAKSAAKAATSPPPNRTPKRNAFTKPPQRKQTAKSQPPTAEDKRQDKISADWHRLMSTRVRISFFSGGHPEKNHPLLSSSIRGLFLPRWLRFARHSSQSALRTLTATTTPRPRARNPGVPRLPDTTPPGWCHRLVTAPVSSRAWSPLWFLPLHLPFFARTHVLLHRAFS